MTLTVLPVHQRPHERILTDRERQVYRHRFKWQCHLRECESHREREWQQQPVRTGLFFNPFIETEYQGVLTAQRSAMDTMLRDLDSAAQEFVSAYRTRRDTGNGNLPDIESRIQKAANLYEETAEGVANR